MVYKVQQEKAALLKKAAYFKDHISFNHLQVQQCDHLNIHPLYSDEEKGNMIVLLLSSCGKAHKQVLIQNDWFRF